jgi:hypothetical protein
MFHELVLFYYVANHLSFRGSLDEAYAGDLSFADSLQAFGAGLDDPVSVAIGGQQTSKSNVFCPSIVSISSRTTATTKPFSPKQVGVG